jgi:hypothetical protein
MKTALQWAAVSLSQRLQVHTWRWPVTLKHIVNETVSNKGTLNDYLQPDGRKPPKSDYTVQQDAEI